MLIGLGEWPVFRPRVAGAWRWVFASMRGVALGMLVGFAKAGAAGVRGAGAVAGPLSGAATGLALVQETVTFGVICES